MNICVFCSSSSNLDPMYTEAADALGREIARRGHTLVFGGYDMGLMGAVARAAVEESGRVLGVTTEGLSAKGRAAVEGIEECAVDCPRAGAQVGFSDAFVSLPGSLGTFDEFFSVISRVKAGEIEAKTRCLTWTASSHHSRAARQCHGARSELRRLARPLRHLRQCAGVARLVGPK
ncbi:MAG: LOG family protein [Slackia sp.]